MTIRSLKNLILGVVLASCAEIRDVGNVNQFSVVDSPSGVTVFYDRDVQTIFNRSCTGGCHEPGGTGVMQAGLDLTAPTSFSELLDATLSRNGPQVVVSEPENSILMWKVEGTDASGRKVFGDAMPQGRPALDAEDLQTLRTWISEGALWSVAPPSPPRIDAAGVRDSVTFEITFDKTLDPGSAVDITHLRIQAEDGTELGVSGVILETDRRIVVMADSFLPGVTYTVTVTGLTGQDQLSIITPETASLRYLPIVSFAAQIQPVFDQSCAFIGCHAADDQFPPGAGLILDAGSSLTSLINVPSQQIPGVSRVTVVDPDASYLIRKLLGTEISGDRMPSGGSFLSPSEIQVFLLWIEQGGQDN
jgi:hypothetical protein